MVTRIPFCMICKNYKERQKCEAFPDGIPEEIFINISKPKHTEVIDGQIGNYIYEERE